jgi:hypothetical protein
MPAVVYLLCGLTGSGKTSYAKRLEAGGAVRLSVDEEVYARHGRYGVDYPIGSTSIENGRWSRSCAAASWSWSSRAKMWCSTTGCGGEATATPTSGWSRGTVVGGGCCT